MSLRPKFDNLVEHCSPVIQRQAYKLDTLTTKLVSILVKPSVPIQTYMSGIMHGPIYIEASCIYIYIFNNLLCMPLLYLITPQDDFSKLFQILTL